VKLIDLFCGAGGLSLGMQMAGHEVVAAYDHDESAIETYRLNLGDHAHVADIRTLIGDDLPDCDGIIGGPPCQALSSANTNDEGWNSPRNMIPDFVRVLLEARPKFFVVENVMGLLRHSHDLGIEIGRLMNAGYLPALTVLNAADYGVPQERKRVFIIGHLNGSLPLWPEPTHNRRNRISARTALAALLKESEGKLPPFMRHLADGGDKLIHGCNRSETLRGKELYYRSFDRPAFTILARGKGGGIDRAWVNGLSYPLTIQHVSTLQSFPSDWQWPDARLDARRQIGNAVPPLLAYAIGRALM